MKKQYDSRLGHEGSLYFNKKVPFYFDYGGEITKYSGDPVHQFDVHSEISYHGSHVASIAAGNAETYKGIAPKAQLICLKVFTNYKASLTDKLLGLQSYSGAYDLPIMEALEDCMTLGVDGINMSLGSNLDDFDKDSITVKTLHKLAESGILTAISAGNSGKTSYSTTGAYANWTQEMTETGILSGYANDPLAMTIAAGQPTQLFYENGFKLDDANVAFDDQIVNNEIYDSEYTKEYKTEDLFKDDQGGYTKEVSWVYIPGFGTVADYGTIDASGKLVVVNRGSTAFSDKYNIAVSKGAIGLVIINNDPTASDFNFRCSFGDDFRPSMPCSLVLYKDKPLFEERSSGKIKLIRKEVCDNPYAKTISSFSTDGATYDLDLKPEITTPGENIRGAVPPQKSEDRTEERKYKVYEYLSGTSMAAPNYAGVQSVMVSKIAADIYAKGKPTATELKKIKDYAATVDMRLMSTADPMTDIVKNQEGDAYSLTSPRKQGAGMVNLGKAYDTGVYLEGLDLQGNPIGKSKIALRNNADINKGVINLKFLAHNETDAQQEFKVKLVVMRPSIASTQDIVTKDYNDCGEFDDVKQLPGKVYWEYSGVGEHKTPVQKVGDGTPNVNDVYKASKIIEYYATKEDLLADKKTTINIGRYVYTAEGEWADYAKYDYQSVYDVTIAEVPLKDIVVKKGTNTIQLESYTISQQAKQEIAKHYEYGCFLEGYVFLESKNPTQCDLSMPYMGYYSTSHENGGDYSKAPVVEPFSFEKNSSTVYPSDLVNSLTHDLLGKDKCNMESMWVEGYVEPGTTVNVDSVLKNDDNFANLPGFSEVGKNPATGEYYENPGDHIYVGSENYSNTMIIQQFVLRSVKDNYFTITNKKTGKAVYTSVLEDMLFGERGGLYPLYKSHVDDSYLGAGYVCHRAYAVVPLYDSTTGVPFESGDYEIKFNYLLAGTNAWASKSYNLTIDSVAPEVSSITTRKDENGQTLVDINIKEARLASAVVGKYVTEFEPAGNNGYKITLTKDQVIDAINENMNEYQGSGRLYIQLTDAAYGKMGIIVRFGLDKNNEIDFSKYVMVQHHSLKYNNDFEDDGSAISLVTYDKTSIVETPYSCTGFVLVSRGPVNYGSAGCGGSIQATSIILCLVAALSATLLFISKTKKKKLGGKNNE